MGYFPGQRQSNQRRYDYLSLKLEDTGEVMMMIYEGSDRKLAGLFLDAKTARKIAAELVKLADEAEGVKP